MNILLGLSSLVLGLLIFGIVLKLLEIMCPKVFSDDNYFFNKTNYQWTNNSFINFYLNKIKNCVITSSVFLMVFYLANIIEGFLISNDNDFWITIFIISIYIVIILIIWIIIQSLGDYFYEHGLKGIKDKSTDKQNKFVRFYYGTLGLLLFSLFLIPFSYNQFDYDENIYNYLFPLSYYGLISMVVLALGLVGLEIRVESNIKERTTVPKDNDDYS
jgi:hypothetical protein